MFTCCVAQTTEAEAVIEDQEPKERPQNKPTPRAFAQRISTAKFALPERAFSISEESTTDTGPGAVEPPARDFAVDRAPSAANGVPQFDIRIRKGEGQTLGMYLASGEQTLDSRYLGVEGFEKSGIMVNYNIEAEPHFKIEPGDTIVGVNHESGMRMLDILRKESDLTITLRKAVEVTLAIPKDGKLGLDIQYQGLQDYLVIKGILDGCAKKYNAAAPNHRQLRSPSRIVAVDGYRGQAAQLYEKLQNSGATVLLSVCQRSDV